MSLGPATTADEALAGIDLSGKTIVVTGSSAGIGVETVRALARAGAEVVMAARNMAKNEAVAEDVRRDVPGARLALVSLDLADTDAVRRTAAAILGHHPKIHALINNAGFVGGPRILTREGAELHFAANHLGPFLLTNLLLPALKAAAPSRVVVLASNGHRTGGYDADDLDFTRRPYSHWTAYSQSKMANVLFAVGLAKRLAGTGITANAVHPGVIRTEVFRDVTPDEEKMVTGWSEANGSPVKSLQQGAATQVWAATSPDLADVSGKYLEDCQVARLVPAEVVSATGVVPEAYDVAAADRLWAISEKLLGQTFPGR